MVGFAQTLPFLLLYLPAGAFAWGSIPLGTLAGGFLASALGAQTTKPLALSHIGAR